MARPITKIVKPEVTEEEKQAQTVDRVLESLAQNPEGIQATIKLLQELHDSGILGALNAAVEAKEDIAKIVVGQMVRPPVTNMINNAMAAAGGLTELDPDMTKKLMSGVTKGLQRADEALQSGTKVGIFDLMKALRDPDINRAMGFGINLLKGIGEGLKE
ncbi:MULTISPECIES: DUF1641 domain-containing protein [Brevibacillus]|uniref:DUF1641 domain-containing protein n=1 Tax=Brevibacillus TaxID=55080 RepID=UPI00156B1A18|nr:MULTISPECIES: DUF1641 domain-containing protein [Brevibacillus]MDH6348924.1 uncharacterized protein YjgD (DUF1641 family) [Brevibacillus sp. 1238]UED71175.1 DUF1641 domain-containing protein [Brevibacillus sp. HD3.3A]